MGSCPNLKSLEINGLVGVLGQVAQKPESSPGALQTRKHRKSKTSTSLGHVSGEAAQKPESNPGVVQAQDYSFNINNLAKTGPGQAAQKLESSPGAAQTRNHPKSTAWSGLGQVSEEAAQTPESSTGAASKILETTIWSNPSEVSGKEALKPEASLGATKT